MQLTADSLVVFYMLAMLALGFIVGTIRNKK